MGGGRGGESVGVNRININGRIATRREGEREGFWSPALRSLTLPTCAARCAFTSANVLPGAPEEWTAMMQSIIDRG